MNRLLRYGRSLDKLGMTVCVAIILVGGIVLALTQFDLLPDDDSPPPAGDDRADWDHHPAAVPILMYHHLDEVGSRFAVTRDQFREHLTYLRNHGFTTITITEYLAALDGAALPERPVVITIDDGYASQWGFVELLQEFGMRGCFFIPNGATLTSEQVAALTDVGDVGGHTVSHPFLSSLTAAEQWVEVEENAIWIANQIGQPVWAFAYPFGDYDDETVPILQALDYSAAFDAWGGPAPTDPARVDRWHIPRIEVSGEDDLETFAGYLAGAAA